ncbi:hypothetical protein B9Z19DRAFT_1065202 [Tuber borchii]|uniref:Uncharacterized protein n=1 Tax=Tuber borchii TaxID=42251 RepID=A0A2T6ZRX6_TUBBO|nr:hypothetical protein B9Z19DRAFT_1065202 [Tuber borchii]
MLLPRIYQYNDFFSAPNNSTTGLTKSVRQVFQAILKKYQNQDVRSVRNYSTLAFPRQSSHQGQCQKPSKQLQLGTSTPQRPNTKRSRPRSQHGKSPKFLEIQVVEITSSPENPRYNPHPRHHSRKHTSKGTNLKLEKPKSKQSILQSPKVEPKSLQISTAPVPLALPTPAILPPFLSSPSHHLITTTPQLPGCTSCTHTPCGALGMVRMAVLVEEEGISISGGRFHLDYDYSELRFLREFRG